LKRKIHASGCTADHFFFSALFCPDTIFFGRIRVQAKTMFALLIMPTYRFSILPFHNTLAIAQENQTQSGLFGGRVTGAPG